MNRPNSTFLHSIGKEICVWQYHWTSYDQWKSQETVLESKWHQWKYWTQSDISGFWICMAKQIANHGPNFLIKLDESNDSDLTPESGWDNNYFCATFCQNWANLTMATIFTQNNNFHPETILWICSVLQKCDT